jgi:hypothetical protein
MEFSPQFYFCAKPQFLILWKKYIEHTRKQSANEFILTWGRRCNRANEELHNFKAYSSFNIIMMIKKRVSGGMCRAQGGAEKCIQNFGRKGLME